ncbi:hypothetical protein [Niabella aquatica]
MNTKKINFIAAFSYLIIFLLQPNITTGQQYEKVIPPSPTIGTLKRFGEFPMDYSTGTINIAIPVHNIVTKDFSIPIKMSFNARGRMGTLNYSPLGVGWALTSLDYITREINGKPDEYSNLRIEETKESLLDVGTGPEYNNKVHEMYEKIISADPEITTYNDYPIWDASPDIYSYSINGNSGKYIINNDGNRVPLAYTTLRFSHGEVVMDDKGNEYFFGETASSIEYYPFTTVGNQSVNLPTTWYLSRIITAAGDTIKYNYESLYTGVEPAIQSKKSNYRIYTYSKRTGGGFIAPNPLADGVYETQDVYKTRPYMVSLLRSIVYPTGKLELFYDNGNKKLDSIVVSDVANKVIKTVNFNYINTPGTHYISNNNSISLANINIKGDNNVVAECYNFEYYNVPLPLSEINNDQKFSCNNDWWGYCNDYGEYPPVIPDDNDFIYGRNGSKDANEILKLNGMLKKIIYPTGGITEFVFENNKCVSVNGVGQIYGPGLRIIEVKSTTDDGKVLIKKIKYGQNENGLGILPYLPNPNDFRSHLIYKGYLVYETDSDWWNSDMSVYLKKTYTPFPAPYLSKLYTMPIFYDYVTEYRLDAANNSLGKTEYYYYTPSLTTEPSEITDLKYTALKEWTQSKLREKKIYKSTTSGYQLLEHSSFQYTDLNYIKVPGVSFIRNTELWLYPHPTTSIPYSGRQNGTLNEERFVRQNGIASIYTIINHPIESAISVLTNEHIKTYTDNNNEIATTKNYEYGNLVNVLPTRVTTLGSDGKLQVSRFRYTNDFIAGSNVYFNMVQYKNMVSNIIERVDSVGTHQKRYIKTNYFSPYTNVFVPLDVVVSNGSNGALYTLYSFKKYNQKGGVLERQQATGANEVYVWGYGGQYPVAKIETYKSYDEVMSQTGVNQVILNSLSSSEASVKTELNKLNTLDGSLVSLFTYKPEIGVTSVSDPSNRLSSFVYDNYGRLHSMKDDQSHITASYRYKYNNIVSGSEPLWSPTGAYRCIVDAYALNTGVQEREEKDLNSSSVTYNQIRWSITGANPQTCPINTEPVWRTTGNTRCQKGVDGRYTHYEELEMRDLNPNSSSFNQLSWFLGGYRTDICFNADDPKWQDITGTERCAKDSNGDNIGSQEIQQKDINPLSSTYNQYRWFATGYNHSACPLPSSNYFSPAYGITINSSTLYNVGTYASFSLQFSSYNTISTSPVHVATIYGNCRPSQTRTLDYNYEGRLWHITINTDGTVYWFVDNNSTSLPPNTVVNVSYLQYNL